MSDQRRRSPRISPSSFRRLGATSSVAHSRRSSTERSGLRRVIVVDQGQRAEIGSLLEEVKARSFDTLWVPSSQTGRAAGVNRGIERATTRFVAVTDDDCLVGVDWVERLARTSQRDGRCDRHRARRGW